MKKLYLIIIVPLITMFIFSGCWSHKELTDIRFVAGAAIDYDEENNSYMLTAEIINILAEQGKMEGELFQSNGKTIFEAIRNLIMKSGRKLYWAHAKVIVISKDIAEKSMIPAIDMIYRDAEMRGDMSILVSEGKTASEILEVEIAKIHKIHSFHLDDSLKREKSISKYHRVPAWRFIKDIYTEGISPTLPLVKQTRSNSKILPEVVGTAVFKGDKLIGTLNDIETKSYLWIINELKGGIFIVEPRMNNKLYKVGLEILNNKTKVKPVFLNEKLTMKIDVNTNANIGEISGVGDLMNEDGIKILQKEGERFIKRDITEVIKKVQKDYHSDIFGFASIIKAEMPEVWKEIRYDWDEVFTNLNVDIKVRLNIKGSAMANKPIQVER